MAAALTTPDAEAWCTLRSLLDEALALTPAARPAWLEALGPEHEALKPRLRQLLSHAENGTGLDTLPKLDLPPHTNTDTGGADDDLPTPLPPDIGPYRPLRLLGEGGMGRVWLAERLDIMRGRPVALKLPHAAWRHAGLAERMAREREILAVLDHPHIARLIDAGVAADGQPYLALDYVEGQRIDLFCREAQLGVHARVRLFLQVVQAVAHAHGRLVVHRDLKPGNILVTPQGEVRLLDFGIAKLLGPEATQATALTAHGARLLTPHYAAPEQIRGEPIGTAADIYALGVVLFELLTNTRPYRLPRESPAALEQAVLEGAPQRPSASVADAKLRRTLRGDLDTIVLKAMKKAPAERYATADALADDLTRWLARRPVLARPDSLAYRARRFVQRHQLGVTLASALMLTLGAGLAHTLWQAEQVRREAAKATAVKDFLVSLFQASDVDLRDGAQRRQQTVQQLLEQSAAALARADSFPGQPALHGELQQLVSRLMRDLGLHEGATQLRLQRSLLLAQRGAGQHADAAERAEALRELAESQRDRSAWADARRSLQQAAELCAEAGLQGRTDCLGIEIDRASVDTAEQQLAPALARLEPLLPLLRRQAPGSPELANALELLGLLHTLGNRPDAADALLQEALALRAIEWGPQSVRLANMRHRIGRNLWAMRHLERALAELRAASATFTRAFGAEHLRSARVALSLGRLSFYVGAQPDGLSTIRQAAAAIVRQAAQVNASELLDARVVLANALLLDGRLDEAAPALDAALALQAGLDPGPQGNPMLEQTQARYLMDTGRYEQARQALEQSRTRAAALHGADHPEVADRGLRLAGVALAEGDLPRAEREIDAVLASQDSREAAFGSVKHKAELARVNLLLEQGRFDAALPLVDAAWQAAARLPRGEKYRDLLHALHEQRARTLAGLGASNPALSAQAGTHFEQAIALLVASHEDNPCAAATRARYAEWLASRHELVQARQQLALAQAALRAQPQAGPQFQRPLQQASSLVALAERAGRRAPMAGSSAAISSSRE